MRKDKVCVFIRPLYSEVIGEVIEYGNDYYRVTDISEFYIYVEFIDEFREAVRSAINQGQFDQGQLVRVCVDAISPYLH